MNIEIIFSTGETIYIEGIKDIKYDGKTLSVQEKDGRYHLYTINQIKGFTVKEGN